MEIVKSTSGSLEGAQQRHERYRAFARRLRVRVLEMVAAARSSHVGGALSMADLLAVLYGGLLRVDPTRPDWPQRDRFVLSKGHACVALYATLAERGFFHEAWLDGFYRNGGRLAGHVTTGVPGVEVSTGSLGHGLSLAVGMALAGKWDDAPYRVFTILSDGDCDEGSTWEGALFAAHHALDNLVAIVDFNKIQSLGRVEQVLNLAPFADKWQAFGWEVREIDGHDVVAIEEAITRPVQARHPLCIIAHTIKGKGVSFMENRLEWHYRPPEPAELERARLELEGA